MRPLVASLGGLLLSLVVAAPPPAQAVVFTVTKLTDSNDGLCNADCSLREAILAANATLGSDVVSVPAGVLTLSIAGRGEDNAATGDLDLIDDVEIRGQGVGVTVIDGNALDRIFDIFPAAVLIADLTVRGGRAEGGDFGGGISNTGELTLSDAAVRDNTVVGNDAGGGGIFNSSVLRIERTTVADNMVTGNDGNGGGIENTSDLEVFESTISGNRTNGLFGNGGGLINSSSAILRNTTISGNAAGGMFGDGGGVHTTSELTLLHCTIFGNTAGDDGDAIAGSGLQQTFTNTLISGDCDSSGTNVTQGGNLESPGNTCGFSGGDQTNVSSAALALGPLAHNGGPTQTHALQVGSVAIDRAANGPCPSQDQRLESRPADGDDNGSSVCDVGAFEVQGPPQEPIFADGFESGTLSAWTSSAGSLR